MESASGMRVSVRQDDPGRKAFAALWADDKGVEIYLDGVKQTEVVTADEREGMIVRWQTDDSGELLLNPAGDAVLEETRFGAVEIRIVPR